MRLLPCCPFERKNLTKTSRRLKQNKIDATEAGDLDYHTINRLKGMLKEYLGTATTWS